MSDNNARLVYSTDVAVPRKGKQGLKEKSAGQPPSMQRVTVRLDRKGRGGKSVTVIEGLQLSETQREDLLRRLKSGLGTGGTVRESALEIQGDHREFLMTALAKMGYRPKRSGG
jgi:translation initiation factor 1